MGKGLGIGDWGFGNGEWGPSPITQPPAPPPQPPFLKKIKKKYHWGLGIGE